MAETRTQQERSSPNFNYFIALKLSAKETNVKVIDKAIADIKAITDDNAYGERLKALTADMETVMHDGNLRKQEADAAVRFKLNEMMDLVKNIALNNGMIFKSELQTLRNNANKEAQYYTFPELEKEVLAFIGNGSVKYIDDIAGVKIPFKDFDRISDSLQSSLRMSTLYEFLGVSPNASEADINAAKQKAYNEYMAKGDRSARTLGKTLCGDVETILLVKEARGHYNDYIKLRDKIWKQFALRKQYGAKSISLNEFYNFAQIIMDTLGRSIDSVEVMLGAGLKAYALTVAGGDKEGTGVKDLEICPYPDCGKIYEAGAKVCPHCGKPFEILCWNCGGKMSFTMKSKLCAACGASYQGKEQFTKTTAQLDRMLLAPDCDLSAVEMNLSSIKNIVRDYKRFPNSTIFKKVAEYEAELSKRKNIEETIGNKYRAAIEGVKKFIAEKNYIQAKNAIENVKRSFPSYRPADTAKIAADIEAVISRARTELQNARAAIAANNDDQAAAAAMRALELCADFNEARLFIAQYPPKPPLNVRFELGGSSVRLMWQLSPSRSGTTYSVIRKVGSMPANAEDGSVVASFLSIDFFEDKSVSSATRYYYGVYATRAGVNSPVAVCRTPVQIFSDITNLRQEMIEGKIAVKWDAPDNVKEIQVWRQKGPVAPQRAGDGEAVKNVAKDGFADAVMGEYSYLILCKYEIAGQTFYSKGVSRCFKTFEMLKPITGVTVKRLSGCEYSFAAKADTGTLHLLFSPQKLACRTDTLLQIAGYSEMMKGAKELTVSFLGDQMSFVLPQDVVGYVYPLVSNDQLYIVAPPVEVNSICGVRDLSYKSDNTGGIVSGNLHPSCVNVIAKISERGYVSELTDPADTIKISASEFKSTGGIKLSLKRNISYYVTVFTEVALGGRTSVTNGERLEEVICQRDRMTVKFCMEYTANPMKPFKVSIKFAADSEAEVPDMLLMRGSPKPLNKSRGELVEKIVKMPLKKGLFSKDYSAKLTLTVPPMARDMSFALFPADENTGYVQLKEVIHL